MKTIRSASSPKKSGVAGGGLTPLPNEMSIAQITETAAACNEDTKSSGSGLVPESADEFISEMLLRQTTFVSHSTDYTASPNMAASSSSAVNAFDNIEHVDSKVNQTNTA